MSLSLFLETRPGEEVKKVKHVQCYETEKEDKEKAEDKLRCPDDDVHFAGGFGGGSASSCRIERRSRSRTKRGRSRDDVHP